MPIRFICVLICLRPISKPCCQSKFADLGVQRLQVNRRRCGLSLGFAANDPDGTSQKQTLPLRYLVGMYVNRQFCSQSIKRPVGVSQSMP